MTKSALILFGTAKGRIGQVSNYYGGSPVVKDGVYYNTSLLSSTGLGHTAGLLVLSANDGEGFGGRYGYSFDPGAGGTINCSSPTISDSIVYSSSDSTLYAVKTFYTGLESAFTYNLVWKYKAGGAFICSPTTDDVAVYSMASDGKLYAFDKKSGSLLWTFLYTGSTASNAGMPSPVAANGIVYVASVNGVWAFLAKNGQVIWHKVESQTFRAAPAVLAKDGKVFLCTESGSVN